MGVYRSDPPARLPPPGPAGLFTPAGAAYLQQQGPRQLQRLQCYFREYPARDTYQRSTLGPRQAPFAPAGAAYLQQQGPQQLQRPQCYFRDYPARDTWQRQELLPNPGPFSPAATAMPPAIGGRSRLAPMSTYYRDPTDIYLPAPKALPLEPPPVLPTTIVRELESREYHRAPFVVAEPWPMVPAFLCYEPRRNLLNHTESLDNQAFWTELNCTVTPSVSDPGSGSAGVTLVETGANGFHFISQSFSGAAPSATHAAEVYIRPNGRTWAYVQFVLNAVLVDAYFDLSGAGAVGTVGAGGSATIAVAANGYYRCAAMLTADSSPSPSVVYVMSAIHDNLSSFAGSGASAIDVAWPQAEAGASEYQPIIDSNPPECAHYILPPMWPLFPQQRPDGRARLDAARSMPVEAVAVPPSMSSRPVDDRSYARAPFVDMPSIAPLFTPTDPAIFRAWQSAAWRRDVDRARLIAQPFTISSDDPLPQPPNQSAALWREAPRARFVSPVFTISSDDPLPMGPLQKAAYGRDERREPLPQAVYTISADTLLPQPVIVSVPRREPDRARQPVPPFALSSDTLLPQPVIATVPRREPDRARQAVPPFAVSADTLLPQPSIATIARREPERARLPAPPFTPSSDTLLPQGVLAAIARREPERARLPAPLFTESADTILPQPSIASVARREPERARLPVPPFTVAADTLLPAPSIATPARRDDPRAGQPIAPFTPSADTLPPSVLATPARRDDPRAGQPVPSFTPSADTLPPAVLATPARRDDPRAAQPVASFTPSADSLLPAPVIATPSRRDDPRAAQPQPPFTPSSDSLLPAPTLAAPARRDDPMAMQPVAPFTPSSDALLPAPVIATPARRDGPRATQPAAPFTPSADSLPPLSVQPLRATHLREQSAVRFQSAKFVFVVGQPFVALQPGPAHRRLDERARLAASALVQGAALVPPTRAQAARTEERRSNRIAQPGVPTPAAELPPTERRDLTAHLRQRIAAQPSIARTVPEEAETVPPVSLPSAAYRRRADAPIAPRDLSVLFEEPMLLRGAAIAGAAYLRAESWVAYFRRYPLDARRPLLGLACLADVSPNAALASSSPYGTISLTGLAARLDARSPKAAGAQRSPSGTITNDTPGCE